MGFWDWIGPTSLTKRRGWDALPSVATEAKSYPYIDDQRAVIISPLVHGPGASDILNGQRVGDSNSAVYACLQVIATAIAEPELRVYRVKAGERVQIDDSPLGDLLAHPNPHLSMDTLLSYLSNCLRVDGNGYWRKLRAGNELTGNVVELWPICPTRIEPKTQSGSGDFISFYLYHKGPGQHDDIPPENMVHFRMGLSDRDHRLGDAPLKRLAREVSSDAQATRYADRLLSNLAVNGLSVEWDKETQGITPEVAAEVKARIQAAYSGDNIGAVSVLSPGAKLVSHGFSPEQMDLKVLHRVPEERIAAVLGVPAIVAGLGAGLDRSTYANFREAREAFTEMTLIPTWRAIAATITMSLLPNFISDKSTVVDFDTDDVRALADDQNALALRLKTLVEAGILTEDEARAEIGREPKAQPSPGPAQQRSRPVLIRTLPLARKSSLDSIIAELQKLHDQVEPDWIEAAVKGLAQSSRRIRERLLAGAGTADDLVPEVEATLFGRVLEPLQLSLLREVNASTVSALGVQFDLDDPATREYLRTAGNQIVGITDTTREAIRDILVTGQAAGESIEQIAERLVNNLAFGLGRGSVIARTELGHAMNTAAIANYRASGVVVGVTVFDGDYDAECAAMNGRTFALDQAPATLQHPNCRRAFAPITDASELTRSA